MNILKRRYTFFDLSLLVIVPGLVILAVKAANRDLPLALDFTGGSLLEVQFEAGAPQPADAVGLYDDLGIEDAIVTTTESGSLQIRSSFLDENLHQQVLAALREQFGESTVLRFDSVGPTIGKQVASRAGIAVAVAALVVVAYITYAFRGIPHAFRYGVCAIIAMVHDVALVFSLVAIGSIFFGWQMDSLFLTALLTVIGFSVQDKIVVFDRIRENSAFLRRLEFEKLVNHSIIDTLQS